jgi:hypothetical protein
LISAPRAKRVPETYNHRRTAITEPMEPYTCAAGFDVRAFPGRELGRNGGGGPTCLTRPILRSDAS